MATMNTRIALRNDTTANWLAKNPILLKGEIGIEFDDSLNIVGLKAGNGSTTWVNLPYISSPGSGSGSSSRVFQVGDLSEIAEEVADGDIAIVKTEIGSTGKFEYTAYVYTESAWAAMDGNYSAENVYFKEDLVTTSAVGNISLTNGQATISAAGKNLKQVFDTIFVTEKNPSKTDPSITITASKCKAYEVGTRVSPDYSISFNKGSYTYGPDTGVTATGYMVSFNNENKMTQTGTFSELQVTDSTNMRMSAYATHSIGAIPVTNLGNEYPSMRIQAGATSTKYSSYITGFRKMFYGTMTEKPETMTSGMIRALASSEAASNKNISVAIPLNCYRVVIAVPSSKKVSKILDVNGLNANITSSFSKTTVNVEGANGYSAIAYNIYYIDYANPNDKANTYTVTVENA